jgi:hypothetical protein
VLGEVIDHYEETIGEEIPDQMPIPLHVHRREGEPCPRCGTTIVAIFSEHQTNYCRGSRPAAAPSRTGVQAPEIGEPLEDCGDYDPLLVPRNNWIHQTSLHA